MDTMEESAVMSSGSSSIGDAVSGRGEAVYDDGEEDLYYIPERRPSLDLGTTPMDTSQWHFVEQALSPAQSYKTMSSEEGAGKIEDEDGEGESSTRVELHRADSFSSCYSFDSDDCESKTPKAKDKENDSELPGKLELIQDPDEIKHPSLTVKFTFKTICETLKKLSEAEFGELKWELRTYYRQLFSSSPSMDIVDLVDRLLECFSCEQTVQITKTLLTKMGKNKEVEYMQTERIRNEVRYDLCNTLKKKYGEVSEDMATEGEKKPIDDIYADLHILSTGDHGPNIEHEVMTIPKLNTKRKLGDKLSVADVMSPKKQEELHTRLMLLTGVAGSGKSMLVRKLVLDWAEERSHNDVNFVFPLTFRELKQFEGSKISVVEMVHTLYPETTRLNKQDFSCYDCTMLFIFDGLDEYNEVIDFSNTELFSDPEAPARLNVIVVNFLRGWLLSRSLCLFTIRSQVKACIPWDTHYDQLEVLGFCDPEKDEYFKKRFKDPNQAGRVIEHVKSLKTLHIMCHLPLFCSLVADECQHIFSEQGAQAELPRNITYMYTKLLLALTRHHRRFRAPDLKPEEERDFLLQLGKLALATLEQGKFKIKIRQWPDISVQEAMIYSGLCTQYGVVPYVLCYEKVVSFLHPTMQEYLAALYAYLSFRNEELNVFEQHVKGRLKGIFKGNKIMELYKAAVDKSLQCEDGKLDIFLRFLFGMTHKTNQELLQTFCKSSVKVVNLTEDAAYLIRKRIKENQFPNRSSNLQQCLEELGV